MLSSKMPQNKDSLPLNFIRVGIPRPTNRRLCRVTPADIELDYCEKLCGKRSPHFLKLWHFLALLTRLYDLPTSPTNHAPQGLQK